MEELDFEHFPAKRVSGDPGEGVDSVPELRRARGRRGVRVDSESSRRDVEGRAGDVPDLGVEFAVTRRDEVMNRNLGERTSGKNSK
ncbi:hypothetical protein AB0314_18600 [Pseudarthrobacter oxydans]